MPKALTSNWSIKDESFAGGGQGNALLVASKTAPELIAFAKTLKRPRDRKARGRFVREVTAYQVLSSDRIPKLLDDNAEEWKNASVNLFLVTELIPGQGLYEYVRAAGSCSLLSAVELTIALTEPIADAHAKGIVHRDIKPSNIVLRGSDLTDPVLVDFGLSFNHDASQTDLTKVGEEVGNRFLRLPEHSFGGRESTADICQCAGILFFALSGETPRALRDDENRAPHQRPDARAAIESKASGETLLRLLSFFDRAFAVSAAERFQTIVELRDAVGLIMAPEDEQDDESRLRAQVSAVTSGARFAEIESAANALAAILEQLRVLFDRLARQNHLQSVQSAQVIKADGEPPAAETSYALYDYAHGIPSDIRRYRIELHGEEAVISAHGDLIWRNYWWAEGRESALTRDALADYMRRQ